MQGGGGACQPRLNVGMIYRQFEWEWAAMTGGANDKTSPKQVKGDRRRTRLGQQLRANLLKRKAQAKAKKPPRDGDEGRQS
jgi:hypothetical protein